LSQADTQFDGFTYGLKPVPFKLTHYPQLGWLVPAAGEGVLTGAGEVAGSEAAGFAELGSVSGTLSGLAPGCASGFFLGNCTGFMTPTFFWPLA
jgi:hypothetical protein